MHHCYFCNSILDLYDGYVNTGDDPRISVAEDWVPAHVCKTCARETHPDRVAELHPISQPLVQEDE